MKKKQFQDTIEEFINKSENKDWWRVVRDELNNQDVVLSDKQLQMLDRIRTGKTAVKLSDDVQIIYKLSITLNMKILINLICFQITIQRGDFYLQNGNASKSTN